MTFGQLSVWRRAGRSGWPVGPCSGSFSRYPFPCHSVWVVRLRTRSVLHQLIPMEQQHRRPLSLRELSSMVAATVPPERLRLSRLPLVERLQRHQLAQVSGPWSVFADLALAPWEVFLSGFSPWAWWAPWALSWLSLLLRLFPLSRALVGQCF